jgi:hypothetical protein
MHNTLLVGGDQGLGDLEGDAEGVRDRNRPPAESLHQILPLGQLHDEEVNRLAARSLLAPIHPRLPHFVNCGDVRMIERRQQPRLALEPR